MTATDQDIAALIAERRTGVGGSDAAGLLGLGRWGDTAYTIWEEKLGLTPPKEDTEAMWWGRAMEPLLMARYEIVTGYTVEPADEIIRHPDHPYLMCHLDGRVDETRIVEAKTTGWRNADEWGEPGTDEIPAAYLTQCHHNMMVTGALVCDVPVRVGSDFRVYSVDRDEEMCEILMESGARFWNEHVIPQIPPAPQTLEDCQRRWAKATTGKQVELDAEVVQAVLELQRQRATKNAADKRIKALQQTIALAMEDGECGTWEGEPIVTYPERSRAGYEVQATTYRQLSLTKVGKKLAERMTQEDDQ